MKSKFIFILIIILGFVLRFYQLGNNPASLDWDEAALGYNAYSISKTAKDEYGIFLPISMKSFGDYKPPFYTYFSVIPVSIFGLNEFSTRFTSAFFGILAVYIAFFLIKELLPEEKNKIYLLSVFLFAISPWHIQFSRIAFEANTSLTLFLIGVLFFLKGLKKGKFIPFSAFILSISLYAYHSARLVVPLFVFGLGLINYKKIMNLKKWAVVGIFIAVLIVLPIFISSSTSARFGSVTIINPFERLDESIKKSEYDTKNQDFLGKLTHNRRLVYAKDILGGYLDHFSFDFLFLNGDLTGRHHASGMGMLYMIEFPLVFIGMYYFISRKRKGYIVLFLWFILAPMASAMTKATPHAVRSLLYFPTYQIFIAAGILLIISKFRNNKLLSINHYPLIILYSLLYILNIYYYLHQYYIHTPVDYAPDWQYGYKQAVESVNELGKDKGKIIVSIEYDQPYIFFLFYNRIDPLWYQKFWNGVEINRDHREFGKYDFRKIDWENDSKLSNVLIIGSPKEIPKEAGGVVKDILFPDGSIVFRIAKR
jgi:4-amino-4-deoxy-L-arabinose transferase-like glycosyltransferase